MTILAWSAVFGTGLGLGLWLVVFGLPILRRPTLAERISPSVREHDVSSRLLADSATTTPLGVFGRLFGPTLRNGARRLSQLAGPGVNLERRLEREGRGRTVEQYRAEQLILGVAALCAGCLLLILASWGGWLNAATVIGVAACCVAGAYLAREWLLNRRIVQREQRMLEEFPAIAELLALSVGAGESVVGALERVSKRADGELATELGIVLAASRAGIPIIDALNSMAARTTLGPLSRFVAGLTVAIERGTPLADVLRSQAQDVRDHAKRELLETAGKKEIAMMVPVVFGIMPVTIIFAVFPGLALLTLT